MLKIRFNFDEKAYKSTYLYENEDYGQPKADFIDYERVYKYAEYYDESVIENSVVYIDGIAIGTLPDEAVKKLMKISYPFRLYTHVFGGPYRQYYEYEDILEANDFGFDARLEVERL